mmetsp:Transcript_8313/g.28289  ORF Transcript_8313/g.28289 Transcript_8313/m.28289 type:complete len:215 (+) Transcript_8313:592-1236(+)
MSDRRSPASLSSMPLNRRPVTFPVHLAVDPSSACADGPLAKSPSRRSLSLIRPSRGGELARAAGRSTPRACGIRCGRCPPGRTPSALPCCAQSPTPPRNIRPKRPTPRPAFLLRRWPGRHRHPEQLGARGDARAAAISAVRQRQLGNGEGREAVLIGPVRVRASAEEELHAGGVPRGRRGHERGPALPVRLVHARAPLQEQLRAPRAPGLRGQN